MFLDIGDRWIVQSASSLKSNERAFHSADDRHWILFNFTFNQILTHPFNIIHSSWIIYNKISRTFKTQIDALPTHPIHKAKTLTQNPDRTMQNVKKKKKQVNGPIPNTICRRKFSAEKEEGPKRPLRLSRMPRLLGFLTSDKTAYLVPLILVIVVNSVVKKSLYHLVIFPSLGSKSFG